MGLRTEKALLNKLAKAVDKATDGYYGTPKVFGPGDGWGEGLTFAWDGPFEWTMITAGSSVYAGDTGNYGTPTEAVIQTVLDEISAAGYFLEAANSCHLHISRWHRA
jgi:hypothetical protein